MDSSPVFTNATQGVDPEVRRIPVATGVSLHALVWLAGSARPYLLVHGLSSNCRTWAAVARRLHGYGHPVAAVDLRGHGRSDKPDRGYDFATMTSDLQEVIAALGFDRPVLAGQSTGGNLAVELAHRAPGSVAAVAGVDGGALELQRRWPRWEDCHRELAPPRFEGTTADEFVAMIRRHHPDWPDEGVAATLANMEVLPDGTVHPWLTFERHLRILRALWEHRPSLLLPTLNVPVLLVVAGTEGGTPEEDVAHAGAAGAHVTVGFMDGDHDLHVQHPVAIADLLVASFSDLT
jgi:pimeloyl-ACP methyl ester carboxylesterase